MTVAEALALDPMNWRALLARANGDARPLPPPGPERAALLARVAACPDRGPVLPVGLQPDCRCAELSECRAGRGAVPGRVALGDCLQCRAELDHASVDNVTTTG